MGCSNCSSKEKAELNKTGVILMGGQSNMVGQGKVRELKHFDIPNNIQYINLTNSPGLAPERFGPEVGVWRALNKEFPERDFIIIKYAIGGSSMLDWSANYDKSRAKITGHPEYGNMFQYFIQKIDSINESSNSELVALLWMQGERDAKVPEAGKDYERNFRDFIKAFRQQTSTEQLPVIYGLINPDSTKYPFLAEVQTAQRKIEKDVENVYLVKTSDLDKWDDEIHYSTKGQLVLGERFGEKLKEIIRKNDQ